MPDSPGAAEAADLVRMWVLFSGTSLPSSGGSRGQAGRAHGRWNVVQSVKSTVTSLDCCRKESRGLGGTKSGAVALRLVLIQ